MPRDPVGPAPDALGIHEVDALAAANRCDFKTLRTIVTDLTEDRLRNFIRALERALYDSIEELERRHAGAPYSGMGGLLAHETEEQGT